MADRIIIEDLAVSLADQERRFTINVSALEMHAGEVVGLSGASGTGKTMLLEMLGLLRCPDSGKYQLETGNKSINLKDLWQSSRLRTADIRALHFGFVPQSGGLIPFLSAAENIALSQRIAKRIDKDWSDNLVERLNLGDVLNMNPGALSIGQRQRVAIARALAHFPTFVIADEPTAALDPEAAETAMSLLIDSAVSGGAGVLISSHDHQLLNRFPMFRLALELTNSPGDRDVRSSLFAFESFD